MPYRVTIGEYPDIKCTTNLGAMFKYALGFNIEELDGEFAVLAFPKLAEALVNVLDPRLRHEFDKLLPENGFGTLDDARTFLTHITRACSDCPDSMIDFLEFTEKPKRTKGV